MTEHETQTEVAVLREQTKTLHQDFTEMKQDVKEIKIMLSSTFVTRQEFDRYKATQNFQKWLIGIITTVITTMVVYQVMRIYG